MSDPDVRPCEHAFLSCDQEMLHKNASNFTLSVSFVFMHRPACLLCAPVSCSGESNNGESLPGPQQPRDQVRGSNGGGFDSPVRFSWPEHVCCRCRCSVLQPAHLLPSLLCPRHAHVKQAGRRSELSGRCARTIACRHVLIPRTPSDIRLMKPIVSFIFCRFTLGWAHCLGNWRTAA